MTTLLCIIAAFLCADAAWHRRESRRAAAGLGLGAVALLAIGVGVLPGWLYIGKVLGRLAMPTGLVWMALLGFAGFARLRRWHRALLVASVMWATFTVIGNGALGSAMLGFLEADYLEHNGYSGDRLDALFVLGGGTSLSANGGGARLGDSGDRLLTAARVYQRREVSVVVTSGSSIRGIGVQRSVAAESANVLVDMGVPRAAIVEIADPRNSSEEVAEYARLVRERGWTRVGVVTSAWHMRRVQRLCVRSQLDAEPIPADFRGGSGWDGFLSVIPQAAGFGAIQRASWELLGTAVGR